MPELPEAETIARGLNTILPGRAVREVEVLRADVVRGCPRAFAGAVAGRGVREVGRRGKNVVFTLDDEMVVRRYRPRDRLEMGVGLDVVDPASVLGYLNDPKEATIGDRNDSPLTPAEARALHGYGLVPDEAIRQIGR